MCLVIISPGKSCQNLLESPRILIPNLWGNAVLCLDIPLHCRFPDLSKPTFELIILLQSSFDDTIFLCPQH